MKLQLDAELNRPCTMMFHLSNQVGTAHIKRAWAAVQVVFAELKPYLRLSSPVCDASESLEHAETSVLMLGNCP